MLFFHEVKHGLIIVLCGLNIIRIHLPHHERNKPCRYSNMVYLFAKPVPVISMITNEVLDFIYVTNGHRIQQWNHQLLSPRNLEHYVDSIHSNDRPLIIASGLSKGLFDLFLGQNATKELSTTDINVSAPSNFSQS